MADMFRVMGANQKWSPPITEKELVDRIWQNQIRPHTKLSVEGTNNAFSAQDNPAFRAIFQQMGVFGASATALPYKPPAPQAVPQAVPQQAAPSPSTAVKRAPAKGFSAIAAVSLATFVVVAALGVGVWKAATRLNTAGQAVPITYQGEWDLISSVNDAIPVAPTDIKFVEEWERYGGSIAHGPSDIVLLKPVDTVSANELQTSGKIFLVTNGTSCVILGVDGKVAHVQITDGVHKGDSGFLYLFHVQRRNSTGHYVRADGKPTEADQMNQRTIELNRQIYSH